MSRYSQKITFLRYNFWQIGACVSFKMQYGNASPKLWGSELIPTFLWSEKWKKKLNPQIITMLKHQCLQIDDENVETISFEREIYFIQLANSLFACILTLHIRIYTYVLFLSTQSNTFKKESDTNTHSHAYNLLPHQFDTLSGAGIFRSPSDSD